jgi:glycosyltransferase involved in cell wall biosynthesis
MSQGPGARPRKRVVVISTGSFSGIRDAIARSLGNSGCEVISVGATLRPLRLRPIYRALMYASAFCTYGRRFREYVNHTAIAEWVRSRASEKLIEQHRGIDAVIGLPTIGRGFVTRKRTGVRYALLTDHVNLLSKKLPDLGVPFMERGASSSWNDVERRALAAQDCVLVLGAYVKDCIVHDYGIPAEQVTVIGAGPVLDVDARRDGIEKDYAGQNVLFVGLDAQRKGLSTLEAAFERVSARFPRATLHIVGVEGKSTASTRYHGVVRGAPLKSLFYSAQVFALPSLREPFGLVFLEAMYAKNVCIGTTLGAMPEIIRDNETGFVVAPGDASSLADRIIWLFEHPQEMKRMAEAGYARASRHYNWASTTEKILKALFG